MLTTTPDFSRKPRKCSAIFVMSSELMSEMVSGERKMLKQQVAGVGFLRYSLQPLLSQICALNHFFRGQLLLLERQLECYCYSKTGTMDGVLQGCLAVQLVTCYFVFVRFSNKVSHTCQLEISGRQLIVPTVCTVEQKVPQITIHNF